MKHDYYHEFARINSESVRGLMGLANMWLSRQGEEGTFDLSITAWETTLDIAVEYGWKPLGTTHDYIEAWSGSYLLNNDQMVTRKDARSLSRALSKGLVNNFEKLRRTELSFVLENPGGSANFVQKVLTYVKRGEFYIG